MPIDSNKYPNVNDGSPARTAVRVSNLGVCLPRGRGLSRIWDTGHWAFRGVEFTLNRGETFAVVGPNGAGKSTLLRTLAGIIEPNEGTVEIRPGLTCSILAPGIGFDRELTGRENIYNSAIFQRCRQTEIARLIDDIVDFSEIGQWIDQPVGIYSAGMRARLGFSLSLFLPSDVLMIDETLSAGDANFRKKASMAVQKLIASDKTVVLISHNAVTLREMCARGLILYDGRMVACGDIDDVLKTYDELVASDEKPRRGNKPLNGSSNASNLKSNSPSTTAYMRSVEALELIVENLCSRNTGPPGLHPNDQQTLQSALSELQRAKAALKSGSDGPTKS